MSRQDTLERFIVDEIMFGSSSTKLAADQSLIESGILDSVGLLRLVAFIEDQFGINIDDGEVSPDNFQTLNSMSAFLQRKEGA